MSVTSCPNCGKEIDVTGRFCPFCGGKLHFEQPAPSQPSAVQISEAPTADNNALRPTLLQYLQSAISLESDVQTQKFMMQDYDQSRNAIKPELVQKPLPEKPVYYSEGWTQQSTVGAAALGWGTFTCWLTALVAFPHRRGGGEDITGLLLFFFIAGLFFLFLLIVFIHNHNEKIKTIEERNGQIAANYRKRQEEVEADNKRLSSLYYDHSQEWRAANDAMHEKFNAELAATTEVLDKLYALDFIYPKYRNLAALTSIYEYFMTGRCTALEGPNGAYNLYENELRMNTVISQLSAIIENLEAIKQNQYMLYQQVKSMTETVRAIHDEVSEIRGYTIDIAQLTALNAYYSAVTARNAQIMTLCHIL